LIDDSNYSKIKMVLPFQSIKLDTLPRIPEILFNNNNGGGRWYFTLQEILNWLNLIYLWWCYFMYYGFKLIDICTIFSNSELFSIVIWWLDQYYNSTMFKVFRFLVFSWIDRPMSVVLIRPVYLVQKLLLTRISTTRRRDTRIFYLINGIRTIFRIFSLFFQGTGDLEVLINWWFYSFGIFFRRYINDQAGRMNINCCNCGMPKGRV